MKTKKLLIYALVLCTVCSVLSTLAIQTVSAKNGVVYYDANGALQTQNGVTELKSTMTTLTTGWYVVEDIVTFTSRININGDVHIILADNACLDASNVGINVTDGNSLTVYSQSFGAGMGGLTATVPYGSLNAAIGGHGFVDQAGEDAGAITINGGQIIANGFGGAAIGGGGSTTEQGGSGGVITINGGAVTAKSMLGAAIGGGLSEEAAGGAGGLITITRGVVNARSDYGASIGGGFSYVDTGGDGGSIKVTGGVVTAPSIGTPPGQSGDPGTFSVSGNSIIFAQNVSDAGSSGKTGGVLVMQGGATYWYAAPDQIEISDDIKIPTGYTLTIPNGNKLTLNGAVMTVPGSAGLNVQSGAELKNNGTIIPAGGVITISGTLSGELMEGAAANPPGISTRSANSVTLSAASLKTATGQSVQYAVSLTPTPPVNDTDWYTGQLSFTGLLTNTTYYFFARSAENSLYKTGEPSIYAAAVTNTAFPAAPAMPTVNNISSTSLTLNWSAPLGVVTGYRVYQDGVEIMSLGNSSFITYQVPSLQPGTEYTFQIAAVSNANIGPRSPGVTVYTAPAAPPAPTLGAVTSDSIFVSWIKPKGEVTGYKIRYIPGGTWEDVGNVTSFVYQGLEPGTRYQFQIVAYNTYSYTILPVDGDFSPLSAFKYTAPATPNTPTFGTVTDKSIVVNWTTPANEGYCTGYQIQIDDGPWINVLPAGSKTYTASGLSEDTVYSFKVRSFNGDGYSSASVANTQRTRLMMPNRPVKVSSTTAGIEVQWDSVGGTAEGYEVRMVNGATNGPWIDVGDDLSLLFPLTGPSALAYGTPYTFQVRAYNTEVGYGDPSLPSSIIFTVPAAPTGPSTGARTHNSIAVTWTVPLPAGQVVTGYDVRVSDDGGLTWIGINDGWRTSVTTSGTSPITHTFTGLDPDTQYVFEVRARNADGFGAAATATAPVYTRLSPPAKPTTDTVTTTSVLVRWVDTGEDVLWYEVLRVGDDPAVAANWKNAGFNDFYNYTGLSAATGYTFIVRAVNLNGDGTASVASNVRFTAPSAPARPTISTITHNSIKVDWTATPGETVAGYMIRAFNAGDNSPVDNWIDRPGTTTTYTYPGLDPDSQYYFKVIAYNSNGDESDASLQSASVYTRLSAPVGLLTSGITTGAITVSWTALPASETVEKYLISKDNGVSWQDAGLNTYYDYTTLTASTLYTFTVKAYNSAHAGDGMVSAQISAATLPAQPTNPRETASTATTMTIAWNAPTGGTAITGYDIEVYKAADDTLLSGFTLGNVLTYTISSLTPETEYYFIVRAKNNSGDGAWSAASAGKFTTIAALPQPGTRDVRSTTITIDWEPADSATGYEISINNGAWITIPAAGITELSDGKLSYVIPGLTAVTNYQFRIRAVNEYGNGDASPQSTQKRTALGPPSTPVIWTITHESAFMDWIQNANVSFYIVQAEKVSDGTFTYSAPLPYPVSFPFEFTDLLSDTEYRFRLIARNADGDSNPSAPTAIYKTDLPVLGKVIFDYPPRNPGQVTLKPISAITWSTVKNHYYYDSAYSAAKSASYNGYSTNSHIVFENTSLRFFGYAYPAYMDMCYTQAYPGGFSSMSYTQRPMRMDFHTFAESGFLFNGRLSGNTYTGYAFILDRGTLRLYYMNQVVLNPEGYVIPSTGMNPGQRQIIGTYKTGISATSTQPYNIRIDRRPDTGGFKIYLDGALVADVSVPKFNSDGFGFFTGYLAHGCSSLTVIQYENCKIAASSLFEQIAATANFIDIDTGEKIAGSEYHYINDHDHLPLEAGDYFYVVPPETVQCGSYKYEYLETDLNTLDPNIYKSSPPNFVFNLYYSRVPIVPAVKEAKIISSGAIENGSLQMPFRINEGESIEYAITLRNNQSDVAVKDRVDMVLSPDDLPALLAEMGIDDFDWEYPFVLIDTLPFGMKYVAGSQRVEDKNGVVITPGTVFDEHGTTGLTRFSVELVDEYGLIEDSEGHFIPGVIGQRERLIWEFTQIPDFTQVDDGVIKFKFSVTADTPQNIYENKAELENALDVKSRSNHTYHTTNYLVIEKYRGLNYGETLRADTTTLVGEETGNIYVAPMTVFNEFVQKAGASSYTWRYWGYSVNGGTTKKQGEPSAEDLLLLGHEDEIIYYYLRDIRLTILYKDVADKDGPDLKGSYIEWIDATKPYFMVSSHMGSFNVSGQSFNYVSYKRDSDPELQGPVPSMPDGTFTKTDLLTADELTIILYFKKSFAVTVEFREYLNDVNILRIPHDTYIVDSGDSFDPMSQPKILSAIGNGTNGDVVSLIEKPYPIYRGWGYWEWDAGLQREVLRFFPYQPGDLYAPNDTIPEIVNIQENKTIILYFSTTYILTEKYHANLTVTAEDSLTEEDLRLMPQTSTSRVGGATVVCNPPEFISDGERVWKYIGYKEEDDENELIAGIPPKTPVIEGIAADMIIIYVYEDYGPADGYFIIERWRELDNTGNIIEPDDLAVVQIADAYVSNIKDFVEDGWEYFGWTLDGDDTIYTGSLSDPSANPKLATVMGSHTVTYLYKAIPQYFVVYIGNGSNQGLVPDITQQYRDTTVNVAGPGTMGRQHYTFLGWALNPLAVSPLYVYDWDEEEFAGADSFTLTATTILYAVWSENDYFTVTYHNTGSTGGAAPVDPTGNARVGAVIGGQYYVNSTVTILGQGTLVKQYHTFIGWAVSESSTVPDYLYNRATGKFYSLKWDDGTEDYILVETPTFTILGNTNLYPIWAENRYTVTYNGNGNTGGTAPVTAEEDYLQGTAIYIMDPGSLVKKNWTFTGWADSQIKAAAGTLDYRYYYDNVGEAWAFNPVSFNLSGDITLYAVWREDPKYTISYNANTGLNPPPPFTDYVGEKAPVADPGAMRKQYYTFIGWSVGSVKTAPDYIYDQNAGTFLVWDGEANDGEGAFAEIEEFTITGNITLFAVWSENEQFKITVHGNGFETGVIPNIGGNGSKGAGWYYVDTECGVPGPNTMKKRGFVFTGWAIGDPDAETPDYIYNSGTGKFTVWDDEEQEYVPVEKFTVKTNVDLYAVWVEKDRMYVYYDGNGYTGGTVPVDADNYYDEERVFVKGPGDIIRVDEVSGMEYIFIGWAYTKAKADLVQSDFPYDPVRGIFTGTNSFLISDDTRLWAVWKKYGPFTVTYNPGEDATAGESFDDEGVFYLGDSVTLSGYGEIRKKGYSFVCWATDPEDPSTYILIGGAYRNIDDHVVLYPVWSVNNYDPKFDLNFTELQKVLKKIRDEYPGKETYTPESWQELTDLETDAFYKFFLDAENIATLSQEEIDDAVRELTDTYNKLKKKADLFTVTINGNGSTGGRLPDAVIYEADDVFILSAPDGFFKENWTFIGWADSQEKADSGTPDYAYDGSGFDVESFVITGNVTLYAVWRENEKYTITLDGNGHTSGDEPDEITWYTGAGFPVPEPGDMSKRGHSFAGWSTSKENADAGIIDYIYTAGDFEPGELVFDDDVTLYAVWIEKEQFTVTYKSNGGAVGGVPGEESYYIDEAVIIEQPGSMTRSGYTFIGWAVTKANADAKKPDFPYDGENFDVARFDIEGDVVLWAVWQKDGPFTIVYSNDGAAGGLAPLDNDEYSLGDRAVIPGKGSLTLPGYVLAGWAAEDNRAAVDPNNTSTYYREGDTFIIDDNMVFYPVWKEADGPDYTELDIIIGKLRNELKNKDKYTKDSWDALDELYRKIIEDFYLDKDNIFTLSQADVDDAIAELEALIDKLTEKKETFSPGVGGGKLPLAQPPETAQTAQALTFDSMLGKGQPSIVKSGETVNYVISVANTGDSALRDTVVICEIAGRIYEVGIIEYLEPGEEKELTFTFKIPDDAAPGSVIRAEFRIEDPGTPGHGKYVDVTVSIFADDHIWYIRGYEDNTLRPDNVITRAEVAMVFFRLLKPELRNITPEVKFIDVTGDEWYGLAINVLSHYNILSGYPDGSFRPNQPITRREMAAVVSRFDNLINTDDNPFNDLDRTDWAYSLILSATKKGWFAGDGNGRFRPGDNMLRCEFVTVTNRILNRHILLEDIPDNVHTFKDFSSNHWAYAEFIESIYTHDYIRKADNVNEKWTQMIDDGLQKQYNW